MLKKSVMAVALLMVISNSVFAADSEGVAEIPTGKTRVEVRERSSEHYRMDKDFELSFSPVSLGGFALTNSGVNAAVFINRNAQVLASYSWNSARRTCSGYENCDLEDKFFSLAFKKFVSNTFYMQVGATQHSISYTESNSSGDIMFGYDAKITTADLAIGNQWNFDGFTMGCDWITFSPPVSSTFSNSFYNSTYESDLNDKQDDWKKNNRIVFAKFYLGATF